jgi:hypothetical protein
MVIFVADESHQLLKPAHARSRSIAGYGYGLQQRPLSEQISLVGRAEVAEQDGNEGINLTRRHMTDPPDTLIHGAAWYYAPLFAQNGPQNAQVS